MQTDWIERVTDSWARLYPELDSRYWGIEYAVSALALQLAKREQAVFAEHGLSRGEVGVLAALRAVGPPHRLSPTDFVNGLMLSSAGVTGRLDRLERGRLVRRLPDPGDRRGVIVELTAKGVRTVDQAVRAYAERQAEWLGALSAGELRSLQTLLSKAVASLAAARGSKRSPRMREPRRSGSANGSGAPPGPTTRRSGSLR